MNYRFAAVALSGFLLAQMGPPGSYNLGVLAVPGTAVPESNPGTAIVPPPPAPPTNTWSPPTPKADAPPTLGPSSGPAYSFGAAPQPLMSRGRIKDHGKYWGE